MMFHQSSLFSHGTPCRAARKAALTPASSSTGRRFVRSMFPCTPKAAALIPAVGHGNGSGGSGNNSDIKRTGGDDSDGSDSHGRSSLSWVACSVALTAHSLLFTSPAAAAKPKPAEPAAPPASQFGDIDAYVEQAWLFVGPALSKLGVSGVLGMATAGLLKFIGRAVLLMVGFTFVMVQALKHAGVLTEVRWGELLKHLGKHLDQDGSGVFDHQDVKILAKKGLTMLTSGVPNVGGFLAGFTFGLKYL